MNNNLPYNPAKLTVLAHRHRSAADYFRRSAFITTEEKLMELFHDLATERDQFAASLEGLVDVDPGNRPPADQPLAYMSKIWRKMKTALIINERSRIVEQVRQTEKAALKRTRRLLEMTEAPSQVTFLLQQQATRLVDSVNRLKTERDHALRRVRVA